MNAALIFLLEVFLGLFSLALLLRFAEPTAGTIEAGGMPLAELDMDAWRAQIAWVPQRPHLFAGTIDGNVSSDVKIMGSPAGVVGSTATNNPPHIPIGGTFVVPPMAGSPIRRRCSLTSRDRRLGSRRGRHGPGSTSTSTRPVDKTPSSPKPSRRQSLRSRRWA